MSIKVVCTMNNKRLSLILFLIYFVLCNVFFGCGVKKKFPPPPPKEELTTHKVVKVAEGLPDESHIENDKKDLDKKGLIDQEDKHESYVLSNVNNEKENSKENQVVVSKQTNLKESKKNRSDKKNKIGEKKHVELAFDNADLYEVLDITLFELFNINYIVDPSINAKLTFHLTGDFTDREFINALNNILQLNNLSIVKGYGDLFNIVRKNSSASSGNIDIVQDKNVSGDITRMMRLRYVNEATAVRNIKPFLSKGADVVSDTVNNAIIITDTKENVEKAAAIISMMDVPFFEDIAWRIFPVKDVDVDDISNDLNKILKTGGLYNRPGAETGAIQILPITTMNAVLAVTKWPSILKLVETWITAMDRPDESSGTDVFVYFVENATAAELADILKQLYGGKKSDSSSKKTKIVQPTKKQEGSKPSVSGELLGDIEIIPDETNNAIVFKATGRDYKIIKEVLRKLDIVPRQVLINVVIAEITLSKSTQYGVEWFLKGQWDKYDTTGGLGDLKVDTTEASSGFIYKLLRNSDVRGLLTALGKDSEINILSAPNILAVDNQEAYIEVGEEVPTETGTVTSTDGGSTSTIQYRKTGIILNVTPHINSSGLVKMELSQEVSSAQKEESLNSYSILNRKAETSLVVENGQTIIMGGLMKTNRSNSDSGVPFLKDIPLLGYLFKSSSKDIEKTELMFLITPRVINTRKEADILTREFSQKIENVKSLVEDSGI